MSVGTNAVEQLWMVRYWLELWADGYANPGHARRQALRHLDQAITELRAVELT